LIVVLLWAVFSFPVLAQSPRAVAEKLEKSVVEMTKGGSPACTATKIAPARFLTARHCVSSIGTDFRIEFGLRYMWPKSVLISLEEKRTSGREDWAVLITSEVNDEIASMELACDEGLYLGMPVAVLGFSFPTAPGFSTGVIASLKKMRATGTDSDFVIDVQAGPGSSGSAVVSMDTGKIIGVLIEGVSRSGGQGAFLVGVQTISETDMCDEQRLKNDN
jgi:S1-C subfamily serine protease